jgi:hypothetical protein
MCVARLGLPGRLAGLAVDVEDVITLRPTLPGKY